jgi:hypothetical protein
MRGSWTHLGTHPRVPVRLGRAAPSLTGVLLLATAGVALMLLVPGCGPRCRQAAAGVPHAAGRKRLDCILTGERRPRSSPLSGQHGRVYGVPVGFRAERETRGRKRPAADGETGADDVAQRPFCIRHIRFPPTHGSSMLPSHP